MIKYLENVNDSEEITIIPFLEFEEDMVHLMISNRDRTDSNCVCTLMPDGTLHLCPNIEKEFGFKIDKNGYIKVIKGYR